MYSNNDHPEIKHKIKKTKRNKKVTECSVKRRSYSNCGICGSENIVNQGVVFCKECESETAYIDLFHWFTSPKGVELDCNCDRFKYFSFICITKCADCGAVKGPFCPNCNKHTNKWRGSNCWQHWNTEKYPNIKYCTHCGYKK